jgi:AcrR family transcriptional regulator
MPVSLRLVADASSGLAAPPAPRSRRATAKSEQTRALILEAAVDSLNLHGVRGANLGKVAEIAGVTRGCLQYYFKTSEDVLIALADYVAQRTWEAYEAQALNPPSGRDIIEFAIDLVASPSSDRYRAAHLELVAAARITPALRPALEETARLVEERAKALTARLFGNAGLADTPTFRAARDLTSLVNAWLFVHIFPDDRDRRTAEVLAALRLALHALWRAPSLDPDIAPLKPRIRVRAVRPAASGAG